MWFYSTNFMGPASLKWYEDNNIPYTITKKYSTLFKKDIEIKNYKQYAGGRIDCYCDNENDKNYSPYNQELSLPIMEVESFNDLTKFLETYTSESFNKDILNTYEIKTGRKLNYF